MYETHTVLWSMFSQKVQNRIIIYWPLNSISREFWGILSWEHWENMIQIGRLLLKGLV